MEGRDGRGKRNPREKILKVKEHGSVTEEIKKLVVEERGNPDRNG